MGGTTSSDYSGQSKAQFQAGGMSGTHPLPPKQHSQLQHEDHHTLSRTSVTAQLSSLREPEPGLGGGIDACINTANEQMQHPINNNNEDADKASKMHPPGARRKHQHQQPHRQQHLASRDGSPHRISEASQLLGQSDKRALHSSNSGPPPKRRTTSPSVGGGHPVKRVGTYTRPLPPHDDKRRRITGKTGPWSD